MAFPDFSSANQAVTINGRLIQDWGESATPFTSEPIDPKGVLRRGQGGGAVYLRRTNNGRRWTLNVNPGSPDSAFLRGLLESGAVITSGARTQIGTLEAEICTEGVVTNDGSIGRAGTTISDDQYIIEFNLYNITSGGA